MADNYDMRQPEMRAWHPRTISEGLPGAIGDVTNWLYGMLPMGIGGGDLSADTQRRVMSVGHGLTKALENSPAGVGLFAHELGGRVGEDLGAGNYKNALIEALAGGAGLMVPNALRKAFGPGNRDANIAATLEAMAPNAKSAVHWMNDASAAGMRLPGTMGALRPNQSPMPPTANDQGFYPMLVK